MSSRCCPRCEGRSAAILTRPQGDFPDFRSILILALRVGFMIRPTFLNSRLRTSRPIVLTVAAFACAATTAFGWFAKEWKSGIEWPRPEVVTPGGPGEPPSDAIVLFDGENLKEEWQGVEKWTVENGVATVGGNAKTKRKFGDCQLHLEFASPSEVKGSGQGRGNSGVYLMDRYEIQILDSYENETYYDGQCGAVYKQNPPLVNASRPPGEWQTYDIAFIAPRFDDDGSLKSPARVTVFHNGVLIQNQFELLGKTFWHQPPEYGPHPERQALRIQFHGNPVQFRNIWIRDLMPTPGAEQAEGDEEAAAAESET